MKKYYLRILQILCRKELKSLCEKYPNSIDDIINWHDFIAIQCVNCETKEKDRILGICVQTSNYLEKLK